MFFRLHYVSGMSKYVRFCFAVSGAYGCRISVQYPALRCTGKDVWHLSMPPHVGLTAVSSTLLCVVGKFVLEAPFLRRNSPSLNAKHDVGLWF